MSWRLRWHLLETERSPSQTWSPNTATLRQDTEYHALSGTRQELCLRKSVSNHTSSVWNFEIIPPCAAYESLGCFFNVFDKTEGGIFCSEQLLFGMEDM